MEAKRKPVTKITFEEALSELEDIVRRLEEGSSSLDESIIEFERGTELARYCQSKLEVAGKKIEILQKGEGDEKKGVKNVKKKRVKVDEETGEIDNNEDIQGSLL